MKSMLVVSVLVASALATPLAQAAAPFRYFDGAPGSASGFCGVADANISLTGNGLIDIGGGVIRLTKSRVSCPDVEDQIPEAYPTAPVQYAIAYVLYKWDGTKAVECGPNPGPPGWEMPAPTTHWVNLTTPGPRPIRDVYTLGCGRGYYKAGVAAYYLAADGWKGGTVYTDWVLLNPATVN